MNPLSSEFMKVPVDTMGRTVSWNEEGSSDLIMYSQSIVSDFTYIAQTYTF